MSVKQLHQKAQRAINRGNYEEAYRQCRQIIRQQSDHADAWFLMSVAAAATGAVGQALELVGRANSLDANNAEYLGQQARYLCLLKRNEEAIQIADKARTCKPITPAQLDTLGVAYSRAGDHHKAVSVLSEAVAMDPDNPNFYFNLASSQQFVGRLRDAEDSYEKAIELKHDFYRAHWALSELLKTGSDNDHLVRLKKLIENEELKPEDELYLCHAIAREYEHLGETSKVFEYLKRGKLKRLQQIGYSFETDQLVFDGLKDQFTKEKLASISKSSSSEAPVFVVGMPRSGTTLMERILDAHSQVISLGELQNFGIAVKRASGTKSGVVLDTEVIDKLDQIDFDKVADEYLAGIAAFRQQHARFVDKLPLNFLYIGHILLAFPQARIICMRRHPLDTCLSNFKQLFAINFSYYNYAYRLEDIASYYLRFDDLMSHWRGLFGERIHEVSYESLVENPESISRGVMDYCGLSWEPECLEFHQSASPVSTASAAQVRKPIYKSALNSWKKYEAELEPIVGLFEAKEREA